jgi:hypothetical protein
MQDVPPLSVRRSWQPAISVVVPAYNEAAGLNRFHHRLARALADIENWGRVGGDVAIPTPHR